MTKNTGEGQKEIGDDGKEDNLRKEEQQRQLGKKKRKINQGQKSGQKKTTRRWAIWLTCTISYKKFLGTRKLKKGIVL